MSWHAGWAVSHITAVLFSSLAWLLISGLAPVVLLVGLGVAGAVSVAARTSGPLLRLRYGVRPASDTERDTVLAALVPIASLRGRGEPAVWVGMKGRDVLALGSRHLLVGAAVPTGISTGTIRSEQVSAAASFALGQAALAGSGLVRAVELFCIPWSLVERAVRIGLGPALAMPLVRPAWAIRPVVFAFGAANAYATGPEVWREVVAGSVLAVLVLTYTTPVLKRRWLDRLQDMGDARVVADGLGVIWAGMLCSSKADPATTRRIERLTASSSAHVVPAVRPA
jgi:hypothetical protein